MRSSSIILTLLVFVVLFNGSCQKPNEKDDPVFYFKGNVNGQNLNWKCTIEDDDEFEALMQPRIKWFPNGDCNQYPCNENYSGGSIARSGSGNEYLGVYFVKASFQDRFSSEELCGLLAKGPQVFGKERTVLTETYRDGLVVVYVDANNKEWTSYGGTGNQNNGFIEITEINDVAHQLFKKSYKVRFSCNLYDETGHSIRVENGEVHLPACPI